MLMLQSQERLTEKTSRSGTDGTCCRRGGECGCGVGMIVLWIDRAAAGTAGVIDVVVGSGGGGGVVLD